MTPEQFLDQNHGFEYIKGVNTALNGLKSGNYQTVARSYSCLEFEHQRLLSQTALGLKAGAGFFIKSALECAAFSAVYLPVKIALAPQINMAYFMFENDQCTTITQDLRTVITHDVFASDQYKFTSGQQQERVITLLQKIPLITDLNTAAGNMATALESYDQLDDLSEYFRESKQQLATVVDSFRTEWISGLHRQTIDNARRGPIVLAGRVSLFLGYEQMAVQFLNQTGANEEMLTTFLKTSLENNVNAPLIKELLTTLREKPTDQAALAAFTLLFSLFTSDNLLKTFTIKLGLDRNFFEFVIATNLGHDPTFLPEIISAYKKLWPDCNDKLKEIAEKHLAANADRSGPQHTKQQHVRVQTENTHSIERFFEYLHTIELLGVDLWKDNQNSKNLCLGIRRTIEIHKITETQNPELIKEILWRLKTGGVPEKHLLMLNTLLRELEKHKLNSDGAWLDPIQLPGIVPLLVSKN